MDRLITLIDSRQDNVALRASQEVLDRAWGKPAQTSAVDSRVDLIEQVKAFQRAPTLNEFLERHVN